MTANPTLLSMPLAQNGQKNVIPETQATPGNGLFSQSTGFPAETSLPLGAGGVAPSREDFNGAFNILGGVAFYAQKGWQFQFDENQAYYAGCIVRDTDDGKLYECLNDVAASSTHPSTDTTNWKEFGVDTSLFSNTSLSNLTQAGEDHYLTQDFTIIYPNGGSEGSPANVTNNTRYVEANPFPGYEVYCVAEVYYDGKWGRSGFQYGTSNMFGVEAFFFEGNIVIQTAYTYVWTGVSARYENPWGLSINVDLTSAPCRVKVWKIGKI